MNFDHKHIDLLAGTLRVAFARAGRSGRPFLLLHGGAGPFTMRGLAEALARDGSAIVPTHPGFDGEPRPDRIARIDDLVVAYLALIERLDLHGVVTVGNSIGGWIAAELALRNSPRIAGVVLLAALGIDPESEEHGIADPRKIPGPELLARAFHDPKKFAAAAFPESSANVLAENQRALFVYAGEPYMLDPTLRGRLARMTTPTLVAWGASDRLVDLHYACRYAASIPGARLEVVPEAGHLPQIEHLAETHRLVRDFASTLR